MKINDLLLKDAMIMDLQATDKKVRLTKWLPNFMKLAAFRILLSTKKGSWPREAQTSTGLGDGIAMPHAKNQAVNEATVLFAKK